ncbi:alpha/beta fold hydrolase [Buchnera aphidicola]|uniref:alpha/beta fold hydrolase n=1 Tax=Buchnera aphidicola TaxID=9 RepID=UPI003464D63D
MKNKFTIILIHGLGFNKKIWFYLKKKLKKNFNIKILNLHTPKKKYHFYLELQKFIQKKILYIPKNSILIGWSLGGLLASILTLKIQEKIKLLITISSSPCFIKKKSWTGLKIKKINKLKKELIYNYPITIKNFLNLQKNLSKKNEKKIKILYKKIINYKQPNTQSLNFNTKILKKIDTRKLIKKINIPIFRIYGKFDIIVKKNIKNSVDHILKNKNSIILDKSNHAPFISNFNLFYKILIKKIKKYISLK